MNDIKEIEELIDIGQIDKARIILDDVVKANIPRQHLTRWARVFRRIDDPESAAAILSPAVRSGSRFVDSANTDELAEYAGTIARLGSVEEASDLLDNVGVEEATPNLSFNRMSVAMRKWDYNLALPHVESYLKDNNLSPFGRELGEVNLLSCCLATGDYQRAEDILKGLESKTDPNRVESRGRLYYLDLQLRYLTKRPYIDSSLPIASMTPQTQLLIRKWSLIHKHQEMNNKSQAEIEFEKLKEDAIKIGNWELVRDSDFFMSLLCGREDLARKVYFGTPFDSYVQRIEPYLSKDVLVEDQYIWSENADSSQIFDLKEQIEKSGRGLESQQIKLINTLCMDFYRPQFYGSIFSYTNPDELFDISTTPTRIRKTVQRSNEWLKNVAPGIQIEVFGKHNYRIKMESKWGISLPRVREKRSTKGTLSRILEKNANGEFSISDAVEILGLSKKIVRSVIDRDLSIGQLEKFGEGKNTKYAYKS